MTINNLSSKRPWVLKINGPKNGGWALTWISHLYVQRTYIHANHRIIKNGGWALTCRGRENTVGSYLVGLFVWLEMMDFITITNARLIII